MIKVAKTKSFDAVADADLKLCSSAECALKAIMCRRIAEEIKELLHTYSYSYITERSSNDTHIAHRFGTVTTVYLFADN